MNYIPQIAKMLGVEMGERFEIIGHGFDRYYFSDDGLFSECFDMALKETLSNILIGRSKIKKLPWKPKVQEMYYSPYVGGGKADYTDSSWDNDDVDLARYDAGLVCRTKEEALEKAKKMLAAVVDDE